jgi:hypothetical protein
MKDPMPTPQEGLTVEEQMAWAAKELAPWVLKQRRAEHRQRHNERKTEHADDGGKITPEQARAERQERITQRLTQQVTAMDRATLIALLDEVDPTELLKGC